MKVVLVGPIPPPNGGMAMQLMQLNRLLKQRGHQLTLIPVNLPYNPAFIGKIPILRALFRLIPYIFSLYFKIKNNDVVHIMANSGWSFQLFAKPAIFIAKWHKVPIVINYRGGKARQFFELSWANLKGSLTKAEKLIVPSTFLQEVFSDFGLVAQVVPNIIDLSIFTFRQSILNPDSLHIIVTRNLEAIYDNNTAIEAFASVIKSYPNARLTIAGSGPLRAELEKKCELLQLSGHVTFCGRLTREEMAELYSQADIMLNPSTIDNMPNSVLEALACGVLVVSTNVGGIPHMVKDNEDALLVESGDPQSMAKAILKLVEQPELSIKLANNGLKNVQNYSPAEVIPLLEKIYSEILDNGIKER